MITVKQNFADTSETADLSRGATWFGLLAATIAFDLGTKWLASMIGAGGDRGIVAPRLNPDFSLGVLPIDSPPLILALLVGAVATLLTHVARLTARDALPLWASALLVGGVAANLVDRLATGAVHDWLHLGYVIANVADIALVIGIAAYVRAAWKAADAPPPQAANVSSALR